MTEYIIKVDERFTHELTVEASSRDEAIETAMQLLRDGMSPELEKEVDYVFESDGFTGDVAAWEK